MTHTAYTSQSVSVSVLPEDTTVEKARKVLTAVID